MKPIRNLTLVAVAIAAAACVRMDREPAAPVHDVWVTAADSGASTPAHLTFVNHDSISVKIVSWSSPDAQSVEWHMTMNSGGTTTMMPLTSPAEVLPGDSLLLVPGAQHLMVTGLKHRAAVGDSITLVIATDRGRSWRFGAKVRAP